jgi:glyceraldehyde-3-phosphate dehydrogenase/erythrose-4-phosphate dehydrogenase
MATKNVLVVGTGTIGEPLIGMLSRNREALGIERVFFHKNTPLKTDRSKVWALQAAGAELCVNVERMDAFLALDIKPTMTFDEAIESASVVIDCTPIGNRMKEQVYSKYISPARLFIAQGSEFGFGHLYARRINDETLDAAVGDRDEKFIQVVSCNTHNLSILCRLFGFDGDEQVLGEARFLCMRRATDISQGDQFIPAPSVGKHNDPRFGTHHARDAWHLYQTKGMDLNLFSSSVKLNTQYMHSIYFQIRRNAPITMEEVRRRFAQDDLVAMTHKDSAATVFSFGRDHGVYGRILNQTVVVDQSLTVHNGNEIIGFCFTPQDGNSLLSSIAATCYHLDRATYQERIQVFKPYFFGEV